jgi:hypothetical protein
MSKLHGRPKKNEDSESAGEALPKSAAKKRQPSLKMEAAPTTVESEAPAKRGRGRPKATAASSIVAPAPAVKYPVKESTKKKDEAKLDSVSDDLMYFDLDEDLAKLGIYMITISHHANVLQALCLILYTEADFAPGRHL